MLRSHIKQLTYSTISRDSAGRYGMSDMLLWRSRSSMKVGQPSQLYTVHLHFFRQRRASLCQRNAAKLRHKKRGPVRFGCLRFAFVYRQS